MSAMNGFLQKLKMKDVPTDDNRGIIIRSNGQAHEESTEAVQSAVHERTEAVHGMFRHGTPEVQGTLNKRSWMWKARRNNGNLRPYMLIRTVISGGVVAMALNSTYTGADMDCCISLYLSALAICLVLDPLGFVERVLALPSRIVLAIDLFLFISTMYVYEENYNHVVWCVCAITGITIAIGNKFWLKSENWLYSDNVEHALTVDPDNEASSYWHGNGRREVRTLLHQIGHDVSEYDLDGMMLPVFALGYWAEYESKTAMENDIAELEEIISENQGIVRRANAIIEEYEDAEERERIYEDLYTDLQGKFARLRETNEALHERIEELEAEVKELQAVPVELPEETEAEQIPTGKEELARYIMDLYNSSDEMSYGKIASIIGKSKTYVANVVREHSKVVQFDAVNQ